MRKEPSKTLHWSAFFFRWRLIFSFFYIVISNGYLVGFLKGKIYTGKGKLICLPGLNCYSCPGALGACPIGSLQNSFGGVAYGALSYVVGIILFFSALLGRVVCGFLCPMGFLQELLYLIPIPKLPRISLLDSIFRFLKYLVLSAILVIIPLFFIDRYGNALPIFCKYLCPSGTIFASLPLLSTNQALVSQIGTLFFIKLFIAIFIVVLSVIIFRPFCKYLCPLGAIYGFFNSIAIFRLKVDKQKCISCLLCEKKCPMNVAVLKNINSRECVRCGRCVRGCPSQCISFVRPFAEIKTDSFSFKNNKPMDKIDE